MFRTYAALVFARILTFLREFRVWSGGKVHRIAGSMSPRSPDVALKRIHQGFREPSKEGLGFRV